MPQNTQFTPYEQYLIYQAERLGWTSPVRVWPGRVVSDLWGRSPTGYWLPLPGTDRQEPQAA